MIRVEMRVSEQMFGEGHGHLSTMEENQNINLRVVRPAGELHLGTTAGESNFLFLGNRIPMFS
jgi:hypothetical protein